MNNFDKLNDLYEERRNDIMNIVWLVMTLYAGICADILWILDGSIFGAICTSLIVGILITLVVVACLELKKTLNEIKKETDKIFVETQKEIDNMILKFLLALDRAIERDIVERNKAVQEKTKEESKKTKHNKIKVKKQN